MSRDVQMFNVCDHIVDNIYYDRYVCPRCYGKSYYIDIHFDENGTTVLAQGSIKLQQEILKIIIDKKFENPFHPEWGCEKDKLTGSKNLQMNKVRLEVIIRQALDHLKNVQVNEFNIRKTLTEEEILNKIDFIEILTLKPDGYFININILNSVNEIITQSFLL